MHINVYNTCIYIHLCECKNKDLGAIPIEDVSAYTYMYVYVRVCVCVNINMYIHTSRRGSKQKISEKDSGAI